MNVILNVVKNLKVSETVGGSANLEMLRFRSARHTERQRLPRLVPSLAMTEYGSNLAMTYSVNEIATSLKALAMTEYSIDSRNDDAIEFDTPKVYNAVNATDSNQGINLN